MVPNMLLVPGRGKDTLVSLINAANSLPQPLTPDELTFGPPSLNLDLDNGTTVAIIPRLDRSIYTDRINIVYQRMDLSQAYYGIVPEVRASGGGDLYSLLPAINQALGLNLQAEDFDNVVLDWLAAGGQVYVALRAKPTSYAYTGSFRVRFFRLKYTLTEVVKDPLLKVFTFPKVTAEAASLSMLTWDIDFTGERAKLKINNRRWADAGAIASLMAVQGFADFPANVDTNKQSLTDLPTGMVAGANRSYDRVVVQRDVKTPAYAGDAYFHYNLL